MEFLEFLLSFLIIFLIIIHTVCLYFNKNERKKREYFKTVPGPPGYPLVGNSLELSSTIGLQDTLLNYTRIYGGIVKMRLGMHDELLVSDQKFIKYILGSNQILSKSPDYQLLEPWLGTGLLTSSGNKWRQRRKVLTPTFHFKILEEFISVFEDVGRILIDKLKNSPNHNNIDIYPYITLCTLDVICETAMGTTVNAQINEKSEYVASVKEMGRIIIEQAFAATRIFYRFTENYRKEKRALKIIHDHTNQVIKSRRKQLEENLGRPTNNKKLAFLDLLLQIRIDNEPLTDADIREEVDTFMFEGHETTSAAISFTLYCLANNPKIQQRAYREQIEIFGDHINECETTMRNLQDMNYLENVIKETLRLYPSVPFFGRQTTEDIEFDGKMIPAGISITLLPYALHRDPELYPDPDEFNPDRFQNLDTTQSPYSYIPFSAGSRNCIGRKFAMLEMKCLISKILRNFVLMPVVPKHELVLAAETILKSVNGVRIGLKRRTSC